MRQTRSQLVETRVRNLSRNLNLKRVRSLDLPLCRLLRIRKVTGPLHTQQRHEVVLTRNRYSNRKLARVGRGQRRSSTGLHERSGRRWR
jgi:pantothenate kinase